MVVKNIMDLLTKKRYDDFIKQSAKNKEEEEILDTDEKHSILFLKRIYRML